MKIFLYVLLVLCGLSAIINAFALDFTNILAGDSLVALISIVAALCGIVLLFILLKAQQLKKTIEEKNDL
jgi:hypothetical protein